MNKTTKHIINISAILALVCLGNTTFAAPILINLEKNFYYDDPVEFEDDGYTAVLNENAQYATVLLSNDPFLGDPNVIIPGENTLLSFEYDFVEPDNGNNDEFVFFLFDSDTFEFIDEFFVSSSSNGSYSFDLSDYLGQTLGLQFELNPVLFDDPNNELADSALDSTVRISNMLLNTVATPVPEPSTTFSFLLGGLLLLLVKRWNK